MEQQKREPINEGLDEAKVLLEKTWAEYGWVGVHPNLRNAAAIAMKKFAAGEHSRLLQSAIEKVKKLTPHHYGTRKAVVFDEVLEILNDPSI